MSWEGPVGVCCGTVGGWSNVKTASVGTECIGARGATGPTGEPGNIGFVVGKESTEREQKEHLISEMYEQSVSEGWYKGTIEEFFKFKERCSWHKKRRPINPDCPCLEMVQTQPSEDSLMAKYNELVEMYYHGTFEDFNYFMSEYDFGFCGGIGDIGIKVCPGLIGTIG